MIKNYKQFILEGLRDKMLGIPDDEIKKLLDNKTVPEKINLIKEYELDEKHHPTKDEISNYMEGLDIKELGEILFDKYVDNDKIINAVIDNDIIINKLKDLPLDQKDYDLGSSMAEGYYDLILLLIKIGARVYIEDVIKEELKNDEDIKKCIVDYLFNETPKNYDDILKNIKIKYDGMNNFNGDFYMYKVYNLIRPIFN